VSVYKVGPSTRHVLVDEDHEGGLPIGFGIILHGSDKNLVYHCIGLEAFDSLAKVLRVCCASRSNSCALSMASQTVLAAPPTPSTRSRIVCGSSNGKGRSKEIGARSEGTPII
jgi:hypothetical protein